MKDIQYLKSGYRQFREKHYARYRELYDSLADKGQAPKTMVVSCCDSRVEPAAIFNTKPGELFVVRNVANLVPPYSPTSGPSGTSAALEFAVGGLGVENIIVMGHSQCGGIKACLNSLHDSDAGGEFIGNWISTLQSTRDEVAKQHPGEPVTAMQRAMEHAAINTSLNNLMSFPFIKQRVDAKQLQIHGGYFDISSGELLLLDQGDGQFKSVQTD